MDAIPTPTTHEAIVAEYTDATVLRQLGYHRQGFDHDSDAYVVALEAELTARGLTDPDSKETTDAR